MMTNASQQNTSHGDDEFIDRHGSAGVIGISVASFDRRRKDADIGLPAPYRFGPKSLRWSKRELRAWMAGQRVR